MSVGMEELEWLVDVGPNPTAEVFVESIEEEVCESL